MDIDTLKTSSGECYASVSDLIILFNDAKKHPENYNEEVIIQLAEEAVGKRKIKPIMECPF